MHFNINISLMSKRTIMKCGLDLSRIHWINRHLLPHYTPFHWSTNESRFLKMFYTLSEEQKSNFDAPIKQLSSPSSSLALSSFKADSSRIREINILKILRQEDKRTTLMIKNIPNKFTKNDFLSLFNIKFNGKFDLFLLPTDINEKKNYGYAFINFINYFYIIHFFHLFNGKKWNNTNSVKICEIVYSKIQGISKMIKHYQVKVKDKSIEGSKKDNKDTNHSLTIAIPEVYKEIFETVYPNIDKEYDNNDKDVFYVDLNVIHQSNSNNVINDKPNKNSN